MDTDPHAQLFLMALGLSSPWRVMRSALSLDPSFRKASRPGGKVLEIELDFQRGASFPCPESGVSCAVHDTDIKTWRHLDFWQHSTYLRARTPRVRCPQHGVRQIEVPWARAGSGFTLLFEMMVMTLAVDMPVGALAKHLHEHDARLLRVARHYVESAHAGSSWAGMRTLAIDETSTRKGHSYATVIVDMDSPAVKEAGRARLIFLTPERKASCAKLFVEQMPLHGALAQDIECAAIDMSPAYIRAPPELPPIGS